MAIVHKDIAAIREDYSKYRLDEQDVLANPIAQFHKWFDEALQAQVLEPNAMTLASHSAKGFPSSRIVLLKDIKSNGFSFFTNYESHKGQELKADNKVSLLFFWPELQRQVRIEGLVEMLPKADSDEYFASRPRASKIGAHASPQSSLIASREVLEHAVEALEAIYKNQEEIPRPTQWGGYLVKPVYMEFWQGRSSRLHDRLIYEFDADAWKVYRIAP